MTAADKLDAILSEIRDIRVILEGLMQPLVTIHTVPEPPDEHRWQAPIRPFGSHGVQSEYADGLPPSSPGNDDAG